MRRITYQHEFLYENCRFKSNDSQGQVIYFMILLIFIMIIITVIIYLTETSTEKCGYAGRNLKMYNTGCWVLGSESKNSSVQRTQVTRLKDKGGEFPWRTKAGTSSHCPWAWQLGATRQKQRGLIKKYHVLTFHHLWSLAWMWTHFHWILLFRKCTEALSKHSPG